MNAVDTNVFVYSFDADEPDKRSRAISFLDELMQRPSETVLLWQVASELLNCLRKWEASEKISTDDVRKSFQEVCTMFELRLATSEVLAATFDLRQRYSLSHWDSMLVAACQQAGISTLFSEDLTDGATYGGVTVVNPFR